MHSYSLASPPQADAGNGSLCSAYIRLKPSLRTTMTKPQTAPKYKHCTFATMSLNTSTLACAVRQQCQQVTRSLWKTSAPPKAPLSRCLHQQARPSLLRNSHLRQTTTAPIFWQRRHESNISKPLTDRPEQAPSSKSRREEQPSYEMTFTCRACTERSSHRMSKQGYHHGTILITCPGCKNRHLISDHLKVNSSPFHSKEDRRTNSCRRSFPITRSLWRISSGKRDNC